MKRLSMLIGSVAAAFALTAGLAGQQRAVPPVDHHHGIAAFALHGGPRLAAWPAVMLRELAMASGLWGSQRECRRLVRLA